MTAFNTARRDGSTTGDREDVFDRHHERLVGFTGRRRDVAVNGIHEFLEFGFPFRIAFTALKGRTTNDRGVVAIETVLGQEFTDFHFDQVNEFFVIDHVAFVQEHDHVRNTDLVRQQDVFASLRHRSVRSGNDQDRTVHLGGPGNHVFNVVSVTRAVNVSVVARNRLVFDVCGVDGDPTGFFFRGSIDLVVAHFFRHATLGQVAGDRRRQRRFTMVNVANGADIYVRFGSVKFFFCHNLVFSSCMVFS